MIVRIFSSLLFFSFAVNADFNLTQLDRYHATVCQALVNSSNSIDNYFIDTNGTESSKTEAEVKTSFALETERQSEYAMRLRLRLNLPKIQKRLRLVFEDEASDDPLYDGTTLSNEHDLQNINYFLRLEYFDEMIRNYRISSGVGVRFRKSSIHPYLNLKVRYVIDESKNRSSLVTNRFRLFVDGDIENILTYNWVEHFRDNIYVLFHNVHRYESWEQDRRFVNSLSATKVLGDRQEVTLGIALNNLYNNKEIKIVYPQLYSVYRDKLYKEWVYYELNPSILWREENDYRTSVRFMVNIGTVFKTH